MNHQWILASRPVGLPTLENFKYVESPLPQPGPGEVLIKTAYLSVDPYMRPRMRNVRSYVKPLEIGQVIEGALTGRVEKSNSPEFSVGDLVIADYGWQEYGLVNPKTDIIHKLPKESALLSQALSVLGMPAMTAYFALQEIGQLKPGETVLISSAAGAVGSIAGQIAKIKGCRVVGITGSDEKVKVLKSEFGYDEAINYKSAGSNIRKALKDACPDGVDVYFDNVGGEISDAAITLIKLHARIIICGQITLYNQEEREKGPRNLQYLLVNRARMEGFLVRDYQARYPEAVAQIQAWMKAGKIKHRETITEGFQNTPQAFLGLFKGNNIGKQLVKVAP